MRPRTASPLVTTRAPIFLARSQSAAVLILASGPIVVTSVPFRLRTLSTDIVSSHRAAWLPFSLICVALIDLACIWGHAIDPIPVFHWRRKAASRAALHRRETERLAVVRHPRILPRPATTFWQSCAASLSQLRTTLLARPTHLGDSFSWLFCRHSSMLFACTGTPLHCFLSSWPHATAVLVLLRLS